MGGIRNDSDNNDVRVDMYSNNDDINDERLFELRQRQNTTNEINACEQISNILEIDITERAPIVHIGIKNQCGNELGRNDNGRISI